MEQGFCPILEFCNFSSCIRFWMVTLGGGGHASPSEGLFCHWVWQMPSGSCAWEPYMGFLCFVLDRDRNYCKLLPFGHSFLRPILTKIVGMLIESVEGKCLPVFPIWNSWVDFLVAAFYRVLPWLGFTINLRKSLLLHFRGFFIETLLDTVHCHYFLQKVMPLGFLGEKAEGD